MQQQQQQQEEVKKLNVWQTPTSSPLSPQQRDAADSGSRSNSIPETIAADVGAFSVAESRVPVLDLPTPSLPAPVHPDSYTCLAQQNQRAVV